MADPVITPVSPPGDLQLPSNVTELVNMMAAYLKIDGLSGLQGVIVSSTEPAASDRDKIWFKLDPGTGRNLGAYRYVGGWVLSPVIVASGSTETPNAKPGELFYNVDQLTLKAFIDGVWTNELWQKGNTAKRTALTGQPIGYLFYDTDISRLLRYTASGWSTVDGCIGEVRILDGVTVDQATTLNPGWGITMEFANRFPMGQSDDNPVGTQGGQSSFSITASAGKNNAQSGSEISLNGLTVGGKTIGGSGAVVAYSGSQNSLNADVDITPPFKSVIFIRKNF